MTAFTEECHASNVFVQAGDAFSPPNTCMHCELIVRRALQRRATRAVLRSIGRIKYKVAMEGGSSHQMILSTQSDCRTYCSKTQGGATPDRTETHCRVSVTVTERLSRLTSAPE